VCMFTSLYSKPTLQGRKYVVYGLPYSNSNNFSELYSNILMS
jgi:hypothetical protein